MMEIDVVENRASVNRDTRRPSSSNIGAVGAAEAVTYLRAVKWGADIVRPHVVSAAASSSAHRIECTATLTGGFPRGLRWSQALRPPQSAFVLATAGSYVVTQGATGVMLAATSTYPGVCGYVASTFPCVHDEDADVSLNTVPLKVEGWSLLVDDKRSAAAKRMDFLLAYAEATGLSPVAHELDVFFEPLLGASSKGHDARVTGAARAEHAVEDASRTVASFRSTTARHYGLVGEQAFGAAERVLAALRRNGMVPARVTTTSEGEIAFYFRGTELVEGGASRRYGLMVCDSDGDITALVEDRISTETDSWDVAGDDIDSTLVKVGAFVEG